MALLIGIIMAIAIMFTLNSPALPSPQKMRVEIKTFNTTTLKKITKFAKEEKIAIIKKVVDRSLF